MHGSWVCGTAHTGDNKDGCLGGDLCYRNRKIANNTRIDLSRFVNTRELAENGEIIP